MQVVDVAGKVDIAIFLKRNICRQPLVILGPERWWDNTVSIIIIQVFFLI